jgi:tRNA A37 threonylcarbamoyladenosine synthetase subunit TsaC/SUA5/YrdC
MTDQEFLNDPDEIADTFERIGDLFLDSGPGGLEPSTIIDFTQGDPIVVRQGAGKLP